MQIGSLDVPGCTGSVTNAQQSSPSHTTVAIGATLGTSFFLVISAIICILLIAAAVRRRNGKKNTVRYDMFTIRIGIIWIVEMKRDQTYVISMFCVDILEI